MRKGCGPYEKDTSSSSSSALAFASLDRYLGHVELKGLAPRTVESYMFMAKQFATWSMADPELAEEEKVRDFFLYLRRERNYSPQSIRQARASLYGFFCEMLKRDWTVFASIRAKDLVHMPAVLSREEVRRVLFAVKQSRFRVCLMLIYECGLRLGEGLKIEVRDIDRSGRRLLVRLGKGGKDRWVPLSDLMINELEWWWKQHRNAVFLFPAVGLGWKNTTRREPLAQAAAQAAVMKGAMKPISESSLQQAFHKAVLACGFLKKVSIHTLRHSYATHLLEEGVQLRLISQFLGHATLQQTLVYTQLTAVSEAQTQAALARMSASVRGIAEVAPPLPSPQQQQQQQQQQQRPSGPGVGAV
jgi:integrase/recombinase XerD